MYKYREIEDPARLKRISDQLTNLITRQLKYPRTKVVGYPSGHAEVRVHFGRKRGHDVHWWSSEVSANGNAYVNLIGKGDPESNEFLMIDLQFNVPIEKFGRAHGGAFVEDIASGAIVLAHRGIVTRGKSRVEKKALFLETTATATMVETSAGAKPLFLVASMDSPRLVNDITSFATEIRRAADAVVRQAATEGVPSAQLATRAASSSIDHRLEAYFKEFCGKRKLPRREAVVVEVWHGRVVDQLKSQLAHVGTVLKSQQVDLAISKQEDLLLFEVKTTVHLSDLYAAIGQLSLHSLAAHEQFPRSKIRKVLVVPEGPKSTMRRRIEDGLGIEVLTFRWKDGADVEFENNVMDALRR